MINNPNILTVEMFGLLGSIKDRVGEFKLIIREDGSGEVGKLNGEIVYDFDTLVELIYHYK